MNIPANIRVNVSFPFPALVTASGPVSLAKLNGIWTIGLSVGLLGVQIPPIGNYPTDYILVWDDVTKTWFKMPLSALPTGGGGGGTARTQRLVVASPIVIAPTDQIINCNIPATAACALPQASTRLGSALTFKDMGQASAHPITLSPFAGDTIDGGGAIVLNNNRQGVTLVPYNDGTSVGWAIE